MTAPDRCEKLAREMIDLVEVGSKAAFIFETKEAARRIRALCDEVRREAYHEMRERFIKSPWMDLALTPPEEEKTDE